MFLRFTLFLDTLFFNIIKYVNISKNKKSLFFFKSLIYIQIIRIKILKMNKNILKKKYLNPM